MTVLKAFDYDTGDFTQWQTQQLKNAYSGTVVNDVRRKESGYAARFEVRSGDDPIGDGHERAEVASASVDINGNVEGGECFVGWSTYFPDLTVLNPTIGSGMTNIFTQVHEVAPSQPVPPIRISIDTSIASPYTIKVYISGQGGAVQIIDIGPPNYNAWNDFVFHAVWSSSPTTGLFELWRDGVKVIQPFLHVTKYSGQDCYLKQGYYRSNQSGTSVVWHDETRVADNYVDAKPPPKLTPVQGQVVRVADGAGGYPPVFRHKVA